MPKPAEGFPSGKWELFDTSLGWRYPNPRLAAMFPQSIMPPVGAIVSGYLRFRYEIDPTPLLARFADDPYFAKLRSRKAREGGLTEAAIDLGSGDYEDAAMFTPAEKCALRYADQMFLDPHKVDAAFYAELKTHFTEPQIMELGAFIAFHYGMQLFMRSLR